MSAHFIGLFLLGVVHVLAIVRVLLLETRNPYSRAAWLMLLVLLPLFGVLIYLFFGEPWMAKNLRHQAKTTLRTLEAEETGQAQKSLGLVPECYQAAFKTCASTNQWPVVGHNSASLMANSNAAIDAMVADFAAAQASIDISFYIWLTDHNGLKMLTAVKQAAARGVVCRVVVDAIGSRALIESPHWQDLQQSGAKVCVSMKHRLGGNPLTASRIDLRNHRKIVVVDQRITYCGSQNCADPEFLVKAKYAPWVDILLRFEGEVVAQNQLLFANAWVVESGEAAVKLANTVHDTPVGTGFPAVAFGTGPVMPAGLMSDAFVATMMCAQQELVVSTPYFVPDPPLLAAFIACARRGVATSLIVPARNDSPFVAAMSRAYYAQLVQAGVRIFEYQGGLLHAKTMVVDGVVALVGSANMDRRSLELNFENNILLYSSDIAGQIRSRQNQYLADAVAITQQDMDKRPVHQVLWQNFLTIFEPIF